MNYDFSKIEKKWQDTWEKTPATKAKDKSCDQKKYYCLDMFPYPSGLGLHMGHWRSYVLSDVYARIKFLEGYNVLHPMGWDAFGLPAENYAIKMGVHPSICVNENIANFKRQLKQVSCIYDWSKEINTTDPDYYKWTQWIFIQMFNAGLAYQEKTPINWCPSCLTGLANEEVVNGECERCGSAVTKKNINQWILRITKYSQQFIDDLDKLEWPEKVKQMQRNWIGRSEGAEINFTTKDISGNNINLPVYTTRPDTIFGATFMVMAPEHELVEKITPENNKQKVKEYQELVSSMSTVDRMTLRLTPSCAKASEGMQDQRDKDKTGVFTGAYAINPITKKEIPIYLSSYVLRDYGFGTIMAVPAHDQRDFDFAKKFDLPIIQVIDSKDAKKDSSGSLIEAYTESGVMINSDILNGLQAMPEAFNRAIELVEKEKLGTRKVNYKLRDWIFSRQRYWGEPIPIVHCKTCGPVAVNEKDLPVQLPEVSKYEPTGTGESPLAAIESWVNTKCPKCANPAKRETNTMPQWAGSSWYFLRYPNPDLKDKAFDKEDIKYWLPVDLYVGGIEHAILHLLYARFYTKVLHDLGFLEFNEPFLKLFNQGMVLKYSEKSGLVEKMSKSKGNVVDPDELMEKYGSDVMRMYIIFMGPPEQDCEWQDTGLDGIKRFINKFYKFMSNPENIVSDDKESIEAKKRTHMFLHDFQERLNNFKPNTAIASIMEFINDANSQNLKLGQTNAKNVLASISIFAPHIASELLENIFKIKIDKCNWPSFDEKLLIKSEVTIVVQVNSKIRANIQLQKNSDQEFVETEAKKHISSWLEGKEIVKIIFIKDKLINFVIK
ncbi:MAG: Leucine-tRNA ligase [candidate division TM6 bacterium GW2011_GWF2_30_66]|nr:MAG: Leucine-tRNA ligase [candidate division TM6 bacterium GW2011_GWF2_30_66]